MLMVMAMAAFAAADGTAERPWHLSLNVVYSSRSLSGEIVNRNAITDDSFGNLAATGDSMNVGTSDGLTLMVGAQYKRWGAGVNYMPTSFSGQGAAIVEVGGAEAGVAAKTPLNTNVEVNLLLGNISYKLIQTENAVFGIGAGFGQAAIDLNIIPAVGSAIIYKGEQPFGFLNMYMANNYKRFLYGFSLNGVSATFDGVQVDYSDYRVDLGYRAIDDQVKCDIVGGYRMVNFAIDLEYGAEMAAADVTLEGPFLGVNFIY
jgi:hypothetical protein